MIVDLALSVTGSQLIASVLPTVSFPWQLSANFLTTYTRRIKNKGRYCMSAFGDISSHSEDARLVPKLFGYCVSFILPSAYNQLKSALAIGWWDMTISPWNSNAHVIAARLLWLLNRSRTLHKIAA